MRITCAIRVTELTELNEEKINSRFLYLKKQKKKKKIEKKKMKEMQEENFKKQLTKQMNMNKFLDVLKDFKESSLKENILDESDLNNSNLKEIQEKRLSSEFREKRQSTDYLREKRLSNNSLMGESRLGNLVLKEKRLNAEILREHRMSNDVLREKRLSSDVMREKRLSTDILREKRLSMELSNENKSSIDSSNTQDESEKKGEVKMVRVMPILIEGDLDEDIDDESMSSSSMSNKSVERMSVKDMSEEIVNHIDKYVEFKQSELGEDLSDLDDDENSENDKISSDLSPSPILPLKEKRIILEEESKITKMKEFKKLNSENLVEKLKEKRFYSIDSEIKKPKGIMRKVSLDSVDRKDVQLSSTAQNELMKLVQHNKKIEMIMSMDEEEIENLHVFVRKLNLINKSKMVSEEVRKKVKEANERMQEEMKKDQLNPKKPKSRRVSFNSSLPQYKSKMEMRKIENWWKSNFAESKMEESEKIKKKMISYLMMEMKKDAIVAKFLYETYVEAEIELEEEGFIKSSELFEFFALQTINDFFKDKSNKITKFHVACTSDEHDLVAFFVENGTGYNELDGDGSTPLHYACSCGLSEEKIKFLVQSKSDPNIKNNTGDTPLHFALKNGASSEVIQVLLENRADPNLLDSENMNSLHLLFSNENSDIDLVRLMLSNKCDPNQKDSNNYTPLDYAKEFENYKEVKQLFK